ncbi:MAG: hypothetical protein M1376_10695 [Planctomycetes bacterium]|nr:hypothetical protein [Planctomycetota bacterium]
MLDDKAAISTFLHYGYLPSPDVPLPAWLSDRSDCQRRPGGADRVDLAPLIAEGVGVLKRVLQDSVEGPAATHIVPLSGGLDSRAILGGSLENLETRDIRAVTFGSPGTWDYEIGREAARAVGVRWEAIDLSSEDWKWDIAQLTQTARRLERPVGLFDTHVNHQVPVRFGAGNVYWSGFMGDPLSGSHLRPRDSATWGEARRHFVRCNRFCRSMNLLPPNLEPQRCLPLSPLLAGEDLCYDEQLDFAVRQQCLIRHTVLPRGYEYRTPFLHPAWVSFILNVPRRYRAGQYLYKEILKAAYPRLFALPAKNNLGLPLDAAPWRKAARMLGLGARGLARRIAPSLLYSISPGLNYIDFDRDMRRRPDLRATVGECLQDLRRRGLVDWIDLESLWQRHQRGRANHADALMLLASLEIHWKAQEETGP